MSRQSERDAAGGEDQMDDQEAFREDPRGKQQVSEQQPETAEDDGGGDPPAEGKGRDEGPGEPDEAGRDDPGEATGNPPNAG